MLQTLTYKANVAPEGVPPVIRLSQNENGRVLIFDLVGTGTVNIPTGSVVTISGTKPDGVVYSAEGTLDGTSATFDEDTQMTAVAGEWPAKLRVTYDGETIASVKIWFAIDADPVRPGSVPSESELNGLVAEAQQYAESARSAAYGSPLTANTAAAMTNTDKVYVYTGSESGYLYGHWYYYNGTAWTDGGVYQSQGVQTDPTLTLEGVPADAKATGDRIGAAEEDVADLKDALESGTRNINTSKSGRYFVNESTGAITENASSTTMYGMSDAISVESGTVYTVTFFGVSTTSGMLAGFYAYYDSSKTFLSGGHYTNDSISSKGWVKTFETPANAKYVAFSIYNSPLTLNNAEIQIESGNTSTDYIPAISANDMVARADLSIINDSFNNQIVLAMVNGYYNSDGSIAPSGSTTIEKHTQKISADNYKTIEWDIEYSESKSAWASVAVWYKDGTFSRPTIVNMTGSHFSGVFIVLDTMEYIAFSYRTYGENALSLNGFASLANMNKISEIDGNTARSGLGIFPNRYKPFYDHLFIEKITGVDVIIPSESLFNVQASRRLGFDMIEANVQRTSDGKFIVMHGESGKFGAQVEHIDGQTDISNTAINSVTLSWIKTNVRYKSLYAKYRVAPPSLEEFLTECRSNCLIPLATCSDSDAHRIVKNMMGDGNYVAYNGDRENTSAPIMRYSGKSTKAEILAECESYGVPYMYCMSNSTDFTDVQLAEIVNTLHTNGYWIGFAGSYVSETESQRLLRLGFDFSASGYQVNDFENGNICNLSADLDYSDFNTNGTVANNMLTLATGQTIAPNATIPSVFLSKMSLHITFSGTINLKMGHIDSTITSDGSKSMWFSSYKIVSDPTFLITATSETYIINISFKSSEV